MYSFQRSQLVETSTDSCSWVSETLLFELEKVGASGGVAAATLR